jgi:hypothetical protein
MFQETNKKPFKVISPVEKRDGGKWWMRCGIGYRNKDESINIYIDSLPITAGKDGKPLTLQVREMTDEELRERSEKRAGYSSRGTVGRPPLFNADAPGSHIPMIPGAGGLDHDNAMQDAPF